MIFVYLTIFPVLMVRRTASDRTNFGKQFVTGTSNVIASIPSGGKGKHLQHTRSNDVRILTVIAELKMIIDKISNTLKATVL